MVLVKVELVHEVHEVIDSQCVTSISHVEYGPFTNVMGIILSLVEVIGKRTFVRMEPELFQSCVRVIHDIAIWFKFISQRSS